jgi:ribosomal protein S18 acetylase RimI-like enzyme
MEIVVREAVVDDAAAVAAVNLASWEAAYRGIVPDRILDDADLVGRTARWRELIAAGEPILVAEAAAGELVGYCSPILPARDADADALTGEVAAIYVAPGAFRGGVGSAMLEAALDLMRERGLRSALLWVLVENLRARTFYARHGFHDDGTAQWIDGLEAEEMRLRRPL